MARTFAIWVATTAGVLAADRAQVLAFCRRASEEFWGGASVVTGWANRDILAHLAGGNDQVLQHTLRAVTSGETPDAEVLEADTDAENERRIEARRRWSIAELIAELERDGDEVQHLLARLTDQDEHVSWGTPSRTLAGLLRGVRLEGAPRPEPSRTT